MGCGWPARTVSIRPGRREATQKTMPSLRTQMHTCCRKCLLGRCHFSQQRGGHDDDDEQRRSSNTNDPRSFLLAPTAPASGPHPPFPFLLGHWGEQRAVDPRFQRACLYLEALCGEALAVIRGSALSSGLDLNPRHPPNTQGLHGPARLDFGSIVVSAMESRRRPSDEEPCHLHFSMHVPINSRSLRLIFRFRSEALTVKVASSTLCHNTGTHRHRCCWEHQLKSSRGESEAPRLKI